MIRQIIVLIPILTCISAACQQNVPDEDIHASLVQGKKSSLIAYSGTAHSFTMEVTAKAAKTSDLPGFVTINKQIVQTTLEPGSKGLDLSSLTEAKEKDVLTKYMNYELAYYKKKLRQPYRNLQTEWVTLQGRLFLLWYFDMPKDYKLVSRQVYLSTLFFDHVMDLNAPVFRTDDFNRAREILVKLAGSLKIYNKHLDLAALSKQLNK